MMLLRRISGVLLLLLGTMGALASAVAIYETTVSKKYLFQINTQAFDSTEKVLENIHDRITEMDLSTTHVRSHLKTALSRADELRQVGVENNVAKQISWALSREITENLAKTRGLVNAADASVVAIGDLLNMVEASGLVQDETFSGDSVFFARVEGASKTLKRLTGLLEQARQTAQNLQHDPLSEQNILNLNREVCGIDKGLAEIQTLGSDFKDAIQKLQKNLLYFEEKTNRWIRLGGILIPLMLVWLGAGQVALIILGGRFCMRNSP